MFYYDIVYYILGIILLPGIILCIYAQNKVNNTFNKYKDIPVDSLETTENTARRLLDANGLSHINITKCKGNLTDNYNPKKNLISLSESTYGSNSIASLGVASHEIGHAMQYRDNYLPMKIRNFLIPTINIMSYFMWPLVIIGLFLEFTSYVYSGIVFMCIGVGIFALSVLLNLITLPIEKDASNRAVKMLRATGDLSEEQCGYVKQVLDAAAMTYLASLLTSILAFIRFVLSLIIATRRND